MRITVIELSHDEAMGLFLTMKNEEPEITEIHEDFEEAINPVERGAIPASPKKEKKTKAKKGKDGRPKTRPVYVKEGDGWKRFPTPKDAAEHIGCERQKVYDALSKGVKCRGHEVSYTPKEEEEEILPRHGG